MLSKGTFGNSKASEVLIEILNKRNDLKLTKWVSKILNSHSTGIAEIQKMGDSKLRLRFINYWTKYHIDWTNKLDTEVGNFTRNVIRTLHKKTLNKSDRHDRS